MSRSLARAARSPAQVGHESRRLHRWCEKARSTVDFTDHLASQRGFTASASACPKPPSTTRSPRCKCARHHRCAVRLRWFLFVQAIYGYSVLNTSDIGNTISVLISLTECVFELNLCSHDCVLMLQACQGVLCSKRRPSATVAGATTPSRQRRRREIWPFVHICGACQHQRPLCERTKERVLQSERFEEFQERMKKSGETDEDPSIMFATQLRTLKGCSDAKVRAITAKYPSGQSAPCCVSIVTRVFNWQLVPCMWLMRIAAAKLKRCLHFSSGRSSQSRSFRTNCCRP